MRRSVRVALGAPRSNILRLVLGHRVALASTGAMMGIGLADVAGEQMAALLAGIGPADPKTFVVGGVLAILMTIGRSVLRALRALRVDAASVRRRQ